VHSRLHGITLPSDIGRLNTSRTYRSCVPRMAGGVTLVHTMHTLRQPAASAPSLLASSHHPRTSGPDQPTLFLAILLSPFLLHPCESTYLCSYLVKFFALESSGANKTRAHMHGMQRQRGQETQKKERKIVAFRHLLRSKEPSSSTAFRSNNPLILTPPTPSAKWAKKHQRSLLSPPPFVPLSTFSGSLGLQRPGPGADARRAQCAPHFV